MKRDKAPRRVSPKTRIMEHELQAARAFIQNDPIGKRLQAAEHILTLLIKEELPRVKRFIFNAGFDLRAIADSQKFAKAINSNPKMTELIRSSKTGGYVRINFEKDCIQFVLFYENGLNGHEAELFSNTFGRIIASTYSSLGIDMSGSQSAVDLSNLSSQLKNELQS